MAQGFSHEEEALGKAYDSRLMKRLLKYLRPYRHAVVFAIILLLASALLQIGFVKITQLAVDEAITEEGLAAGERLDKLVFFALIYLGAMFLAFVARYAQTFLTAWLGQKVLHDIRQKVFNHVQTLSLPYFDRNPVGRVLTRVTSDVNTLNEMFSSGVVTIIGDIFTIVLIVGAMLYYNWQLALITFAVVPLLAAATFVFRAKVRNVYRDVRLRIARLNAFLQEHITGMRIVQLFSREERTFNRFDKINTDLRAAHFKSIYYYATYFPTVEIIGTLAVALVFYFGGVRIQGGSLTFGELVAFITLTEMFYRPIRDLSEKYNILQSSMASSERIFQLLDTEPSIVEPKSPVTIERFRGHISFDNVSFYYKPDEWVLRDVSFDVAPGEKVAIVGATGAGKTSLMSLLFRFYDYQKGSIKLDDVDLKDLSVQELRSHLGLVLQDVFLFSGSVAGNVRLRDEDIPDDEVRRALDRVGFTRFLERLPGGINAEIRERGATLSTGQKQLLSFARALAFDPDILILDEATSSVDTETERLIQEALDVLLKNRTSIIIAHRLSTIEKADKIIVLHHGKLREMGRHDELLASQGIYHKLYLMQYKKESLRDRPTARTTN
jgi:ATP-binding cassette subfamily B protein